MRHPQLLTAVAVVALLAVAGAAAAQEVSFKDPVGDDHGPGTYTYPTDTAYLRGSFDLTGLTVKQKGDKVTFAVTVSSTLQDPWRMGVGFAVQMVFVFIDTDGETGSGFTQGLPGLNVELAPDSAWERVVILSPQPAARVRDEVPQKVGAEMQPAVVIPTLVRVRGQRVSFFVPDLFLGGPASSEWSYVVAVSGANLVQSFDLTGKLGLTEGGEARLMILPVTSGRPRDRFGGRERAPLQPPLVDVLVPAGATQEEVLQSYDLADDLPAELPGVVPAERRAD